MSLAQYGCKLTVHKKATFGVGLILLNLVAMVTTSMIVTYIWNLYSIKNYWLHILVKFRASIANIKRTMVLKNWLSKLKQILTI